MAVSAISVIRCLRHLVVCTIKLLSHDFMCGWLLVDLAGRHLLYCNDLVSCSTGFVLAQVEQIVV